YTDYFNQRTKIIENKEVDLVKLIIDSVNLKSITINKHQHIRSALFCTKEIAALSKQHNNANILSIPARFTAKEQAIEIVSTFLNTPFEGGRHSKRVAKIPLSC